MKKTLLTLLSAATLSLSASSAVKVDASMAEYVYPGNTPAAPAQMIFESDGTTYLSYSPEAKKISRHDLKTGKELETVMDLNSTRSVSLKSIEGFTLSPDGSKILVYIDRKPVYRRSFTARYYVYEIRTRMLTPLSDEHDVQRAPVFSPDGRMVAFVAGDNNIYLKKLDYGTEVDVTRDGASGSVINGVPDWTYEEEFMTDCSMSWAPDNLTLCYLKYNETDVPAWSFPLYEGTCQPMSQYALYPGQYTYKYPVAGQPNSTVSLHSYDVETRKTKDITLPGNDIEYLPRMAYAFDTSRVIVTALDRDQRRMELFAVNPRSGVAKSIYTETADAWLPTATYEQLTLTPEGFTIISSRTGYAHLYSYNYAGALVRTITSGDYNVTAYYGSDATAHYYQSTSAGPIHRVVESIDAKGKVTRLSPDSGWASARFTPGMGHMVLDHSTASVPPVYTLCTARGKSVRTLEDNAAYASRYASAPVKEFMTVPGADGTQLNAYIIKPAHFDPSKRYPVIMNQYSGPESQEVTCRWRLDWPQYAAQQGYVVVCVDPRGTGGRERDFATCVYKQLGRYETADLTAAARYFASQSYVDPSRIGITGWSYGGYQTLMTISAPGSPFAAAVAIAPVTSWRYYDTVYAERYMLTPAQNPEGYEESAPMNKTDGMNIPLLIMHGTADDNVHLFNTMQYVSRLQASGRMCDMFLYPNMNHSINGCDARLNVYSKMLDYFNRNL
ncbi:MAG: S9 family peptidase [Duncaniella sp.]|nr:S9 family peptidase [Duncaniella sp.]